VSYSEPYHQSAIGYAHEEQELGIGEVSIQLVWHGALEGKAIKRRGTGVEAESGRLVIVVVDLDMLDTSAMGNPLDDIPLHDECAAMSEKWGQPMERSPEGDDRCSRG
jgi:hypothetical protein